MLTELDWPQAVIRVCWKDCGKQQQVDMTCFHIYGLANRQNRHIWGSENL